MTPDYKSTFLWGMVGGLTFLVLVQGFELFTDRAIAATVKGGVAIVVTIVAAVSTHVVQQRLEGSQDST